MSIDVSAAGTSCATQLLGGQQAERSRAQPSGAAAERLLNELVVDTLRYRQSKEYSRLLRFTRSFRAYKPFNALLVDVQKPGSTFVAPAGRWRDRYHRRLSVDAQPLVILQPFGPVMFVFDVVDTEPLPDAPPLPLEVTDPFAVMTPTAPQAVESALERLVEDAKRDGVRVVDVPFGDQLAGRIGRSGPGGSQHFQVGSRPPALVELPVRYDLEVNARQAGLTRYATLAHELGHLYCGHLGTPNEKWWPDGRHEDHRTAEFEAGSVAAIALGRLDPTASFPPYLAQHLQTDEHVPERLNLEHVMKAAGLVIEMTEKPLKPRSTT